MARIRTIKPEFWSNETLSEQPEATHMLAAALLNYADDEGYFNANPALVKAACSPLREPSVSIHESIKRLSGIGYLRLGVGLDGRRYGQILKFEEHQRINRPSGSKIKLIAIAWEDSLSPHTPITDPSPPEGNREQGTGNGKDQGELSAAPTPIVERGTSALDAERQTADAIERVFDHWQRTHGHAKATLDKGRRRLIRERLKSYTADDLCASISGFLNSPHHMGQNDRGTRYDSLELLLRDSKHVDMGLGFCARPGRSGPETANDRIERALQRMEGTNGRTYDA
jgi:hypothetical protein